MNLDERIVFSLRKKEMYKIVKEYGVRWNIWKYKRQIT